MKREQVFGGLLILAGLALLLSGNVFGFRIFSFNGDDFWPIFVLLPGLAFEYSYFASGKNPGLLVPGGIMTTLGLLFYFETATDWRFSELTWPVYILAPAVGLWQMYLFSEIRYKALLIPVGILTLVSATSFICLIANRFVWWLSPNTLIAAALILLGVSVLKKRN